MSKAFPVSHVLPEASLFLEFIFLFNLKNSAQIFTNTAMPLFITHASKYFLEDIFLKENCVVSWRGNSGGFLMFFSRVFDMLWQLSDFWR